MKIKEAIEVLKKAPHFPHDKIGAREAIDTAIEVMEKAEKYRWHDLRENPDDLPKPRHGVDTRSKLGSQFYNWIDLYNADAKCWKFDDANIIAWREIEPFEREVEE